MSDGRVAQIRIATPDDAPALAVMHIASWHETYTGLLPDKLLSALSVEPRAAAWAKILNEPATERSTTVHLAEHQGVIIGFGSCGAQRTETLKAKGYDGEISAIYVRALSSRNARSATHLFRNYVLWTWAPRGFKAAALWVLRDNLRARHFYEHFGAKVIGGKRGYSRQGRALTELAYGCTNLSELERLVARRIRIR